MSSELKCGRHPRDASFAKICAKCHVMLISGPCSVLFCINSFAHSTFSEKVCRPRFKFNGFGGTQKFRPSTKLYPWKPAYHLRFCVGFDFILSFLRALT